MLVIKNVVLVCNKEVSATSVNNDKEENRTSQDIDIIVCNLIKSGRSERNCIFLNYTCIKSSV